MRGLTGKPEDASLHGRKEEERRRRTSQALPVEEGAGVDPFWVLDCGICGNGTWYFRRMALARKRASWKR